MSDREEVLAAARAIMPLLTGLLGEQGAPVGKELDRLLTAAETGRDVTNDIVRLLAAYPATSDWLAGRLSHPKSYKGRSVQTFVEMGVDVGDTAFADVIPPAAAAVEDDPPRSAYALLAADDVVVAQVPFELTVGISASPMPGVQGDAALQRPAWSVGHYDLTILVVADGFSLAAGESWRHDCPVTAGEPYPARVLHLTADSQSAPIVPRAVQAIYSIAGQTIGRAFRPISVVQTADRIDEAPKPDPPETVSVDMAAGDNPPDLTVNITFAVSKSDGRLAWTFTSPLSVSLPEPKLFSDPGPDRASFARQIVNVIGANEGKHGIYDTVKGKGLVITDNVPPEFWDLLRAVAQKTAPKPPTILLLSEEPYIPWELAVMSQPLLDPSRPPFLAAQVVVGRWVFKSPPPPKSRPPEELRVSSAAVISGDYSRVLYAQDLPEARIEAAGIRDQLAAKDVPATYARVLACIKGSPRAQLLHFAVHGKYDQTGIEDGLQLIENGKLRALSDDVVRGVDLGGAAPFVFLNACQVGTGNQVLGSYAGIAEAFLQAGASAVIAPLWSVNDAVAKDIALAFYKAVADGALPAELLREQRAEFKDSPGTVSGTHVAYQFFGDPRMSLSLAKTKN